jgi:hypothetical protein
MSTFDSDDLETTGYFLPEDSQLRLKQLREYVGFLTHLARPRRPDEDQEWYAEIRVSEVAICLELLEEQIGRVLDELSRPAERGERAAAARSDAEPEAMQVEGEESEAGEPVTDEAGSRYPFGVTLDQIDELNLLVDMIKAHGDVVIANNDAEFAEYTLSVLGRAIFCDADKLRDIINDVQSQMLGEARAPHTGVGEERAVYRAGSKQRSEFGKSTLPVSDSWFMSTAWRGTTPPRRLRRYPWPALPRSALDRCS